VCIRVYSWFKIGQDNPFPLKFCSTKIEYASDRQSSYSQVIEHPASFMVGNFFDYLRLNDDRTIGDWIRNILTGFSPFVDYIEASQLLTRHSAQTQLNDKAFS